MVSDHYDLNLRGSRTLVQPITSIVFAPLEHVLTHRPPQAQYGMEEGDEEAYADRATNSLKRAVYSGALSVAGYYERSVGLRRSNVSGRDTGSSKTTGKWTMVTVTQ